MPGFYESMRDSVRNACPFPNSRVEAAKSTALSKMSGKTGEHLDVCCVKGSDELSLLEFVCLYCV